jgi:protein tyrosine phosphatase (PTP) superfamily phosphohydrolase (DUF442 family)
VSVLTSARRPRIVLCLALASLAAALAGASQVRHLLVPKRFVAVEPGFLYRSGQISPRLVRRVLEEHAIHRVVWLVAYDPARESHRAEREATRALGIEPIHLPLRGNGTGKISRYADAIEEIARARRAREAVLVHCAAGARRSAGVVAMYGLLVEGWSPERAYRELDRFGERPVAESPLLPYLNDHMGELAALLVERGVLERAPARLPLLRPPVRASLGARLARAAFGEDAAIGGL